MVSKKMKLNTSEEYKKGHAFTYSSRFFSQEVPKYEIPKKSMPANAAYQLVHDELNMDANPALNLASFVNTWMEDEAVRLINENLHKNFIDHDEYPQTEVIHNRCVSMIAKLFNAQKEDNFIGTATIGSSEAIMLALLSHKWNWRKRQTDEHAKPNIVFGAEVHVCWEKFAKYFDVEMRVLPVEEDCLTITPEKVEEAIDENTICVGVIWGTTYSGHADPIEEINDLLIKVKKEKGWDIPIHVDAASGGFITPFINPELKWDFRLERVKSINVSGHKYGLVYPGLGWVIWRDEKDFAEELVFKVNYLGGWMPTYTLNFSRGSAMVIAQYYNFIRLGTEGYTKIMLNCLENAQYLGRLLEKSNQFIMLNKGEMFPVVAMHLKDKKNYTIFDLSNKLRERGWIVSAYTLPKNAEKIAIMRVVVREHFSRDMAEILYHDIRYAMESLENVRKEIQRVGKRNRPLC